MLQDVDGEKGKLKIKQEEGQKEKLQKTRELGMMLMAIDNLYQKCVNRETYLKYTSDIKSDPKTYDNIKQREEYALEQLKLVQQYLEDYKRIIENYDAQ